MTISLDNLLLAIKKNWKVPPILWTAIVGESGSSKSPALNLALDAVMALQEKAFREHAERMKAYDRELAKWEKVISKWKGGDGEEPPPKPIPPIAKRYVVGDTTVEAVVPLLIENPRGLLLTRDELNGWFGSFDRYANGKGGGDASQWLSMYNASSACIDRKTATNRSLFVKHAAVSVVGGIQPGILNDALGAKHRESGLLARLLLCCPPKKRKRLSDEELSAATENAFAKLLDRLYALDFDEVAEGEIVPRIILLDAEAKELYREFHDAHGVEQLDLVGDLGAAWSKLEELPGRLALILHYAQSSDEAAALDVVDGKTMQIALRLTAWFKYETMRAYAVLAEGAEERKIRQLIEWVQNHGGTTTVRDLQRSMKSHFKAAEQAEKALDELVRKEVGYWQPLPVSESGGRPTRAFVLRVDQSDKTSTSAE